MQHIPFRGPANGFQRLFWLVPTAFLLGAGQGSLRSTVAAAVVIGVVWQVLYRRDLADRLTFVAVMYLVAALVLLIPYHWHMESSRPLAAVVYLVMTLVMTEQMLRLRDYRLAARAVRRQRETVPARP